MTTTAAPSSILLIRTSALGDVANALPVLAALRRHLPDTRIGWVVDEALAAILDGHGLLDQVLPVPLRRWRRAGQRRSRELVGWLRRLRAFRAEVAIDLMGNHKAATIARLSGARRRIGARAADRREPSSSIWINTRVPVAPGHAVDRGLALLGALGLPSEPAEFAPDQLACGRDTVPDGDYVFLHPGAAWGNKRYPAAHWGRVAARLAARTGLAVRVGAGPGEQELADRVVAASGGASQRLDAPDLERLAGALRGARLVLSGDTGAAHLGRALGRPVVAVHGPTDPELHGPYSAPGSSVFHRLPCSFCHQRMSEAKSCLLGLPPEAVADAAEAALAN